MDFVATEDFVTPYVRSTGMPHKPLQICKKKFCKGEIITGEVKTVKGRPAFVLHRGVMVIPFSVIKQVVTREISFGADGGKTDKKTEQAIKKENPASKALPPPSVIIKNKKTRIADALILGGIAGFGLMLLAEKQGWVENPEKKNRLYAAGAGAALAAYYVYRRQQ